jgi:PHD/YefM family antitoxin component YafN of YafNO toxin-antitoxin module
MIEEMKDLGQQLRGFKAFSPPPRKLQSNFEISSKKNKKGNRDNRNNFKSPNGMRNVDGSLKPVKPSNLNNTLYVISENKNFSEKNYTQDNKNYLNPNGSKEDVKKGAGSKFMNSKFQKLGTVLDKKTRKISIIEQNRRKTQFRGGDTQAVIEDISPFMVKPKMVFEQREFAKSPQPQEESRFRALSPFNVSDFEEVSSLHQSKEKYESFQNYNPQLSQFNNWTPASPMNPSHWNPFDASFTNCEIKKTSKKTPLLIARPLPFINQNSIHRNTRIIVKSPMNARNEEKIKMTSFEAQNVPRSFSRNNKDSFNTIIVKDNGRIGCMSPAVLRKYGLNKADIPEMNHPESTYLSPPNQNFEVKSLKSTQRQDKLKYKNKVKLAPIKNKSEFIDVENNRKKFGLLNERLFDSNIEDDNWLGNSSNLDAGSTSSKQSKRNRRYSITEKTNMSLADPSFILMENEGEMSEKSEDQREKSIGNVNESQDNRMYIEGSNGRKISIFELKSPVIKKEKEEKFKEITQNIVSTAWSNTINKSSKKSGFKLSTDFFSFGDDEVQHERNNKNKEILNLLSESDFEQIKKAIENDIQKANKESSKLPSNRPFSCWFEDPKAEDNESD